jgi:ABC-type multidrug transport system permease subunit
MAKPTAAYTVRGPLAELTLARIRELTREPEALFWVFVFPILLTAILGLAFRSRPPEVLPVAVVEGPLAAARLAALSREPDLETNVLSEEDARQALTRGRVVLVVSSGETPEYSYDPTQPESRTARLAVDAALQRAAGRTDAFVAESAQVTEPGSRYVDFLVPGLLGMNLMGTGMWGIGFYIVNARSRRLLKRLTAAPMRRSHYLLSQIGGRLAFLVPEVAALLVFAALVFDVPLRGSWLAFAAVTLLGAMTFSGLGLLIASRARTIEGVSGLMNVVMLPMWILSGTFFSTARFPDWLQPAIQALPLTALNDGLRAVMIDGAGLAGIADELAINVAWCGVAFVTALTMFRWR